MMKITYINEMTGETVVEYTKIEECQDVTDRTIYEVRGYNAEGENVATMITKNYTRGLNKIVAKIDAENWECYNQIVRIECTEKHRPFGKFFYDEVQTFTLWTRETVAVEEVKEEKTFDMIVDEFLANWKEKATNYFQELYTKFKEIKNSNPEITAENLAKVEKSGWGQRRYTDEMIARILNKIETNEIASFEIVGYENQIRRAYMNSFTFDLTKQHVKLLEDMSYENRRGGLEGGNALLEKFLTRDVESKKDQLIKKVTKQAGEIVTAKDLRVNDLGDLDGIVEGTEGKVKVTTFSAGGWNIQMQHYRIKVTKIK